MRQVALHMPSEAAGAAVAALLMAQGYYVASHAGLSSSAELFPAKTLLRDFLRDGHTYDWLLDRDVTVPRWIAESDG